MIMLAPGQYRVVLPIAQEPIYVAWEASHYELGVGPRVITLRRMDNGLFSPTTEVTYTFEVRAPTEWPDGLPQPQPHSGDPYDNGSGTTRLVVGGAILGGLAWGAYRLFGRRRR